MKPKRLAVISASTIALVLTVAGCTSGSHGTDTTPVGTATETVTVSGSVTATGGASGTGGPTSPTAGRTGASGGTAPPVVTTGSASAASGPGLCTPTVTTMDTAGGNGGAGGHFAFAVHVVNASSSPCVTDGYPGVALLDSSGRQVEQATRTLSGYMGGLWDGSAPARILLQPGEGATALVEGLNGNPTGPACASSPALLFTLPDNTDATTLRHQTQICDDLQVHPLVAGSSGTVGT